MIDRQRIVAMNFNCMQLELNGAAEDLEHERWTCFIQTDRPTDEFTGVHSRP